MNADDKSYKTEKKDGVPFNFFSVLFIYTCQAMLNVTIKRKIMNAIKSEAIIKNFHKKGQKFYFWWSKGSIIPVEIVSCPKRINEYNPYRYYVGIAFDNINYISVPAHTLYNSRKELIEDRISSLEEDWKIDNIVFQTDRSWYENQIKELREMI